MKSLKKVLNESLRIGINDEPVEYAPTTYEELQNMLTSIYQEQGAGTKQDPIDLNIIDVSRMKSFNENYSGIFEFMHAKKFYPFEYIDISQWDVSNIESMECMFLDNNIIRSIGDISNWVMPKVKNMSAMFEGCSKLYDIGDIHKWDWDNIRNNVRTDDMFVDSIVKDADDVPWCN